MKRLSLCCSFLLTAACTTLAPHAEDIRVTSEANDVKSCAAVGSVRSVPPYVMPGDDLKQLRNQSLALGADTLLVDSRVVFSSGAAYRCKP